ncbi:hypothetical protein P3T36_003347 [Kitasatospora sp. MAP12-15]|uniref:hypothetical protein n=1 Tax=unclassified Kitasatospora TaxID=2633591 RepID=UPI0024760B62|nr:hypothetical protein [Kitasatospora sp. MAP12-44]MDH6111323.1 hypothetical protein [Kitasatospora sp. MAP12-44]
MIPFITRYANTLGLLNAIHLHCVNRGNPRPYAIAAWRPDVDLPVPGTALMDQLVDELEGPLRQFAAPAQDAARPGRARQVWQCTLRTHPDSVPLSDGAWASAVSRVVAAAGIAPTGDEAGCRWIALRTGDHEVRIVAPMMRLDGRLPRLHNDASRAKAVCQLIELETTGSRRHTAALARNIPISVPAPHAPATAISRPVPGRLPAASR